MADDEHVHMLGAKNRWVDCSTHLLLHAAGKPRRGGVCAVLKCRETSYERYHMHARAKGIAGLHWTPAQVASNIGRQHRLHPTLDGMQPMPASNERRRPKAEMGLGLGLELVFWA